MQMDKSQSPILLSGSASGEEYILTQKVLGKIRHSFTTGM